MWTSVCAQAGTCVRVSVCLCAPGRVCVCVCGHACVHTAGTCVRVGACACVCVEGTRVLLRGLAVELGSFGKDPSRRLGGCRPGWPAAGSGS